MLAGAGGEARAQFHVEGLSQPFFGAALLGGQPSPFPATVIAAATAGAGIIIVSARAGAAVPLPDIDLRAVTAVAALLGHVRVPQLLVPEACGMWRVAYGCI